MDEFLVEKIVAHKVEGGKLKFLVKWEGYGGQAKEPGFHESCCRFLIGGLDSQAQEPGLFFDWRGLCGQ